MRIGSVLLVIVQLSAIAAICATAPPLCTTPVLLVVQALSLALIIWTWFHLVPGKFHILPEALQETKIVMSGPFRFIRHPMYLSLMLCLLPLVINFFTWLRLGILLIFLTNMLIKIMVEERHLKSDFPEYAAYMKRSYRLLPFVF